MADSYLTRITTIVSLPQGDDTTHLTTADCLNRFGPLVHSILKELGFSGIESVQTPVAGHPELLAQKSGKAVCLCFAPYAENALALGAVSELQINICNEFYPQHDVYYCCIYGDAMANGVELKLVGPVALKVNGSWNEEDVTYSQFLPLNKRDGMDRYSSIFNAGVLFKLYDILFPLLRKQDAPASFFIKNLFEARRQGENNIFAFNIFELPTLLSLVQADDENNTLSYIRPFFVNCDGDKTDLELMSIQPAQEPGDGVVELLDSTGATFLAECAEAALFPSSLMTGCRYLWTLSLVAEHFSIMPQEISISSGPFYDSQKKDYIESHGCEPPDDFVAKLSLAQFRALHHEDDSTYAELSGQIVSMEHTRVDAQPMLKLTMQSMPDNDDVLIHVFVSPAVLEDTLPKVGDTVSCSGYLYASPSELLEDVPSWMDSAEVGQRIHDKEMQLDSMWVYNQFNKVSMGYAIAAAAFVRAGYRVEDVGADRMFSRSCPFEVCSQSGEKALVCVDTVVNGYIPVFSFAERTAVMSEFLAEPDPSVPCYSCTVYLDYHEGQDRYKVSMSMEPQCPGVENTLVEAACPFRETIPVLEDDEESDEPQEKRLRPAVLDEAMAARLFKDAMVNGSWGALAEWMREEMTYTSLTNVCQLFSKVDFLRYITERICMWKQHPEVPWSDFAVQTGTVMHDGVRRPCCALFFRGRPTAMTLFNDYRGMIGSMVNIAREEFCLFVADAEPES